MFVHKNEQLDCYVNLWYNKMYTGNNLIDIWQ